MRQYIRVYRPSAIVWQLLAAAVILLALPGTAGAQDKFERGLEQYTFVPKGQWITGVSVNYEYTSQKNFQFLIVENLNGSNYTFKISPMLMYAFRDNLAAGGRFSYQRTMNRLTSGDVILDSETEYNVDNLYSISQNYYAMAASRYYISLGDNTRFGMFNEIQLQLGGGQSKLTDGTGEDLTGTYEKNFNLNIGLAPGVIMFLNNYSAIEVNVGVLGFGYTHTKSTTDRIYISDRKSKQANFKVNLFSISFGVAFYL